MELWIRSQDKSSIVKVDNLYVSVGNYICYYVEKDKEVPGTYYRPSGELGRYKTKERALEVLDEIQNILKPKYILDTSSIKPDGDFYEEDDHICETDEDTIWLYIYSKGFMYYESCYPDDTEEERKGYKEKKHFYLPTQKRLDEANGEDWY